MKTNQSNFIKKHLIFKDMKIQNLTELLTDLRDFMDQVQSPKTPSIYLKKDIENYLLQMQSEIFYKEINFTDEKPENGWFLSTSGGWVYDNGIIICAHSGTIQTGINTWLKKVK